MRLFFPLYISFALPPSPVTYILVLCTRESIIRWICYSQMLKTPIKPNLIKFKVHSRLLDVACPVIGSIDGETEILRFDRVRRWVVWIDKVSVFSALPCLRVPDFFRFSRNTQFLALNFFVQCFILFFFIFIFMRNTCRMIFFIVITIHHCVFREITTDKKKKNHARSKHSITD